MHGYPIMAGGFAITSGTIPILVIGYSDGQYSLKLGSHDKNGNLFYCLMKDEYSNGGWKYSKSHLYAAKAVVDEFIVNPDKRNNVYIWHSGFNKEDNYYRNLYPLNREVTSLKPEMIQKTLSEVS